MALLVSFGFGGFNVALAGQPTPTHEASSVKKEPIKKAEPGKVIELPKGQHLAAMWIDTPEGKALLTIDDGKENPAAADGFLTAALATYYRTCSVKIWGVGTSWANMWSLNLSSTFWYNTWIVLRQSTPIVSPSSVTPYSWSDLRSWNTIWNTQYRFADGQGTLHGGVGPVGFSWTYHLYLEQKYNGDCWGGWYR